MAAAALGWHGVVVQNVPLLGERVDVVVQLIDAEHVARLSAGETAFVDARALTLRLDAEPAFRDRAPLRVVGVLARRSRWASARRVARGYGAFGPATAVAPASEVTGQLTALEADCVGIGLVTVDQDQAQVAVPPPAWQPPPWTWVRRYGEEVIYAKMLQLRLAQ